MMMLIHVPKEYILELDSDWRKAHNNHPYWIFPDDPDYEKYVALIK